MNNFAQDKRVVREYHQALEDARDEDLLRILERYTSTSYYWRGMHPFDEKHGAAEVAHAFWLPLRRALLSLQRREDIFLAGANDCDGGKTTWVASIGNFLGLFDHNWLGIPSNGKMAFLPYAEFHAVENGVIVETALFIDILSLMYQAGVYPLPPMTGTPCAYKSAPRTHDGLLISVQDEREGALTLALINRMIGDLDALNKSKSNTCPKSVLEQTWHEDMIWHGPVGIGSSYTIERYQEHHQLPFRQNLRDKVFNGHVARIAEGAYCAFFGWPNLNNKNVGGFLGLPASEVHAPMRVVDVYRRHKDKIAENWVFIDLLHYLYKQGLDVLGRMSEINKRSNKE